MDVNTGHLVEEPTEEQKEAGYEKIPDNLVDEAVKKLAGQREAYVNLREKSRLAKWAKMMRKQKKARYIAKLGTKEINRRRDKRRNKNKGIKNEKS